MDYEKTICRGVFGRRARWRREWVFSALGTFLFTGVFAVVAHFVYDSKPNLLLHLFVLLGVSFAIISAYHHSGLVVSWLLVLAPVCGPLVFYQWLMNQKGVGPVGLIGSFYGHGAPGFYVPLAFALGTLAFGLGISVRWGANYLVS